MATDRLPDSGAAGGGNAGAGSEGVGPLVSGIVQDLERLAQQHIRLFKKDIESDFQKLRTGAFSLGIGLGVALVGALLLGIALAELILLAFPAENQASYRWLAYGIIGILITGVGAALLLTGQKEVQAAAPIADKTVNALEEDVKWLKNPK